MQFIQGLAVVYANTDCVQLHWWQTPCREISYLNGDESRPEFVNSFANSVWFSLFLNFSHSFIIINGTSTPLPMSLSSRHQPQHWTVRWLRNSSGNQTHQWPNAILPFFKTQKSPGNRQDLNCWPSCSVQKQNQPIWRNSFPPSALAEKHKCGIGFCLCAPSGTSQWGFGD